MLSSENENRNETLLVINSIITNYCNYYINKDIRVFCVKHNCWLDLTQNDLDDLKSELKVAALTAGNNNNVKDYKNYTYTVLKRRLKSYLSSLINLRKKENRYRTEQNNKIMEDKQRKQQTVCMHLDELNYSEVRELLKKHLTIQQNGIIHFTCSGYSNEEIGKLLKITPAHVSKLYLQAEDKLRAVLKVKSRKKRKMK